MDVNKIYFGKMEEVLKDFPDNCVDSIVTDPPYGLKFMGKHWDYNVPTVEQWKEAIRVLKPGGFLLSFGGTRTYHRMVVNIEDAGFEIRDQIQWLYGSGFPKSLDISKAIDKGANKPTLPIIGQWLQKKRELLGLSKKEVATHLQLTTTAINNWERFPIEYGFPTGENWIKIKSLYKFDGTWDDFTVEAEREIIGEKEMIDTTIARAGFSGPTHSPNYNGEMRIVPITIPSTDAAKQWEGWGTALKPANEPICVARKPVQGTVAENVLKWGTGGLNIDGCRIELNNYDKNEYIPNRVGYKDGISHKQLNGEDETVAYNLDGNSGTETPVFNQKGRFPANVILDEFMGKELDRQSGVSQSKKGNTRSAIISNEIKLNNSIETQVNCEYDDKGGASRFFYCPKPDNFERNKGLKNFELKDNAGSYEFRVDGSLDGSKTRPKRNHHTTVKPLDLMRYLVRLVTPKKGICLDPFCGSGTTLAAAKMELMNYVGIDIDESYIALAEARVKLWNPDLYKPQELF